MSRLIPLLLLLMALAGSCTKPPEDVRKAHFVDTGLRYLYSRQPRLERVTHALEIHTGMGWDIVTARSPAGLRETAILSSLVASDSGVVGAVNGDFFSQEGLPSGIQISQGRLVKNGAPSWLAFGLDADSKPFIDTLACYGEIIVNQFTTIPLDGFNRSRQSDETILYNRFFGPSTNTNPYGAEATLRIRTRHAVVGDTVEAVVVAIDSSAGNNPLSDSTLVLSAHGEEHIRAIRRMFVGQILEVAITSNRGRVLEAIGGYPALVLSGVNRIVPEQHTTDFYTARTARTAVGFSDSSIVLVCVDKIQPAASIGISLFDLAELMISLGCTAAINLDGGGSTTMWLDGKIINEPAEGGERKIANALIVRKR